VYLIFQDSNVACLLLGRSLESFVGFVDQTRWAKYITNSDPELLTCSLEDVPFVDFSKKIRTPPSNLSQFPSWLSRGKPCLFFLLAPFHHTSALFFVLALLLHLP
jgi:hypothetical protein